MSAAVISTSLLLTGCGTNAEPEREGTAQDPVTITMSWWGNDSRAKTTQEVIKKFEEANPDIKVNAEYSEFGAYWDKLATQVAAGTMPDVITMAGSYPGEYASRGALLDLDQVSGQIDLNQFDDEILNLGRIEGKQYSITAGTNSLTMVLDPAVFESAGVPLPDDNTWTWDDYNQIAKELKEKLPSGSFAVQPFANDVSLVSWARQVGETPFADDGKVSMSRDRIAAWFKEQLDLQKAGAAPSASQNVENLAATAEQTLLGQGKAAMSITWSNQARSYVGHNLVMAKLPSESVKSGNWLRSSMEYTISAKSKYPKAAARLLNFLVNSPEAGKLIKSDRGMPASKSVRSEVVDVLNDNQKAEAAYLDRLADMKVTAPKPFPPGTATMTATVQRFLSEVLFERKSPEDAAQAFIDEVNSAIR
ncbi:ABC transporter substrate-binding protein [Arthrobacter sp. EpRS71]|nr:ABC transporter substrate-binding protein [Arthrobacter sp. EpRS71]